MLLWGPLCLPENSILWGRHALAGRVLIGYEGNGARIDWRGVFVAGIGIPGARTVANPGKRGEHGRTGQKPMTLCRINSMRFEGERCTKRKTPRIGGAGGGSGGGGGVIRPVPPTSRHRCRPWERAECARFLRQRVRFCGVRLFPRRFCSPKMR